VFHVVSGEHEHLFACTKYGLPPSKSHLAALQDLLGEENVWLSDI
jgi:hypothetical protein